MLEITRSTPPNIWGNCDEAERFSFSGTERLTESTTDTKFDWAKVTRAQFASVQGARFCYKTPGFASVLDEDRPEMRLASDTKRTELLSIPERHTKDHNPCPRCVWAPKPTGDEGKEE